MRALTFTAGAVCALALSACAGTPQHPAGLSEAENAALADNNPDKVQCREERVVGSNRPRRLCMTVGQWAEQRRLAKELKRNTGKSDLDQGEDVIG